jgi:hypothetical protein
MHLAQRSAELKLSNGDLGTPDDAYESTMAFDGGAVKFGGDAPRSRLADAARERFKVPGSSWMHAATEPLHRATLRDCHAEQGFKDRGHFNWNSIQADKFVMIWNSVSAVAAPEL